MRPLIRSMFLLSLAAAPLASAGPKPESSATEATSTYSATSDSAADAAREQLSPAEAAVLRVRFQELEASLNGMRRELARIREEEDARTRVIGDPNNHSLWP